MIFNPKHILISLSYSAILSWIYTTEIVNIWGYMGFHGEFSAFGLLMVMLISFGLTALIPSALNARSAILTAINYLFLMPAAVYVIFSGSHVSHYISLGIAIGLIYACSSFSFPAFFMRPLKTKQLFFVVFLSVIVAVILQAAFGGLAYFNLDIERVYEFRRVAAASIPHIFGYLYSNVSSVLLPITLVLAVKHRNYYLVALSLLLTVLLFGMTHHKSVLFGPIAVLLVYMLLTRLRSQAMLGAIFLTIPVACAIEMFYVHVINSSPEPAYLTSLLVRRLLMVPSLLDDHYIQFFSDNPKYWWSASRLGSWAMSSPYDLTAPFIIGDEYFGDADMSANAGIIGSGFANAGFLGVGIYSGLTGLLIGMLNSYGRRIGHAFVTAASLATVFNIVTSTDLLTAFLTHGLLLLILTFALFPRLADPRRAVQVPPT